MKEDTLEIEIIVRRRAVSSGKPVGKPGHVRVLIEDYGAIGETHRKSIADFVEKHAREVAVKQAPVGD